MTDSSLYNFDQHNIKESGCSTQSDSLYVQQESSLQTIDFHREILRKLNVIVHKINIIDRRLEVLEEQCRFNFHRREDDDINILDDEEIGLPLRDEFALDILEGKLKEKAFFENMVHTLKGLGGIDVHSCTTNILRKLLTNSLAEMYSLAGAKKKKDLMIFKIILKTVRIHYKDVTEAEIARMVAKWLVQAKARRERKKYPHHIQEEGEDHHDPPI